MTVWLDLEDVVRYFRHSSRPTGIQRLTLEVSRALWQLSGPRQEVRFCRHAGTGSGFRSIHFPSLEAGIAAAAAAADAPAAAAPSVVELPPRWAPGGLVMRVANSGRRLPPRLRRPVGIIGRAVLQIVATMPDLFRAARAEIKLNSVQRAQIGGHGFDLDGDDVAFSAGDWIVSLGANWETPYPQAFFEMLKAQGIKFAILAHDLIPELFPEWAVRVNAENFRAWLRSSAMAADVRFAVSKSTAADLSACMAALGKQIPPPVVLPVGHAAAAAPDPAERPLERPYVLLVSTIEIRKNHALMFRVWRRLLRDLPAEQAPDLVFAGKIGWLTADLVQQLENTNWLDGKIKFIPAPSDGELAALYRNCLFTVFPSLYEGWGLPVTESLSFGKIVAASDRASLPEAGGDFCVYYDPENLEDAYRTIRQLIEEPARVRALEARLAAGFKPPTWTDTANTILETLAPNPPDVATAAADLPAVAWAPSK